MRMMVTATFPLQKFNKAVRNGTAGEKLGRILDDIKPEAVYFVEQNGKRCCVLVVEVEDASRVPSIAEPFFLGFNASVEFRICMSSEDLQNAGLDELGEKWG